jgi:AcrR family transcriptional regulator
MDSGTTRSGELTPKGELTRRTLLNAARKVFAKQGFLKTEIRDITRRAGKSRATFYNYVGGKTELLLALIADFREDRQKLPIVDGEQMFREQRPLLRQLWEIYRTHAATLNAVTQAAAMDPLFAGEQRELTQRGIENCRMLLRYMQSIGHCRQFDPDIAGFMLATMINANMQQMFSLWNAADLSEEDDATAFENLARMIEAVLSSGAEVDQGAP